MRFVQYILDQQHSNKMKEILIFLLCIAVGFAAVSREIAPVTEEQQVLGYACNSQIFGLMKEGEARNNYRLNLCGEARCSNGEVVYVTCGVIIRKGCKIQHDFSKPYPTCCHAYSCV